jgi:hypothetical protein
LRTGKPHYLPMLATDIALNEPAGDSPVQASALANAAQEVQRAQI